MNYLLLLQTLADKADKVARHYFKSQSLEIQLKADKSPVSKADVEIEALIRSTLNKQHPEIGIWGEEFGQDSEQSDTTLIVDPIDGTRNFIRGIPWFATLLAIQHKEQIVAGLVSSPITQDRWIASRGEGAYHNGKPIHVSSISRLSEAQAFHGSLYGAEAQELPLQSVLKVLSNTQRQRGLGDYLAHVLVANGSGEFSIDFGLKPWDMAPLKIIVEEAGGKVTHLNGKFDLKSSSLICSNGRLHAEVLRELY